MYFDKEIRAAVTLQKSPDNGTMFHTVINALKEHVPEVQALLDTLDYYLPKEGQKLIQERYYPEVHVHVAPGGNEGVYLDWFLKYEHKMIRIGTFKTLDAGLEGFRVMGTLSGYINYASQLFVMANDDLCEKEAVS